MSTMAKLGGELTFAVARKTLIIIVIADVEFSTHMSCYASEAVEAQNSL